MRKQKRVQPQASYVVNTLRNGSKNLVAMVDARLAQALQASSSPVSDADALRRQYKRERTKSVTPRKWGTMVACREIPHP